MGLSKVDHWHVCVHAVSESSTHCLADLMHSGQLYSDQREEAWARTYE